MMKIVLIGDSIRLGYCKYVKEKLSGKAEVLFPEENCRFTQHVFRFIADWKKGGNWGDDVDIVHWNVGLWDVLRLFGDDTLTPIDTYADYIRRIDRQLRIHFPKAKLIFALSTNVQEEKYGRDFKRYNSDIIAFNNAAIKALEGTDEQINDLYSLTENIPDSCRSDLTHFNTPDGVALVGGKVLSVLCQAADIDESSLAAADTAPNKIDKKTLGA